ncbi:hypothetical protein [Streptomyces sp. NPDC049590]|uniref:hypothetical protein n=1 Tax=Streptomyces sp. NPDC049590 TaxID=3154834 RepID=UPI00341BB688
MTDGFMGPPWQMDWRLSALAYLEALPAEVRDLVYAVRSELITVKDPYFRGIDADEGLPDGIKVRPARCTEPKGRHICYFGHGNGWLKFVFVPRVEDPQIVVEELFWLGTEPAEAPPTEE